MDDEHRPSDSGPPGAEEALRILNAFAVSLLMQRDLPDLLWSIARNAGKLLGFEDCVLYLRRGEELDQIAAFGPKNPEGRRIDNPICLPVGVGVVGRVAETGQPRIVQDTRLEPGYVSDSFQGTAELAVPVIYQDQVIAVIDSERSEPGAFSDRDLELLVSMANIAAPRIASALEEDQRRKVERELQRAKAELEERVARRTERLQEAVRTLEEEARERERAESQLESERTLLRLTLDSIEEGMFVTDREDRIVLASAAALEMTGWTHAEAIGRPVREVYRSFRTAEDPEPAPLALSSEDAGRAVRRVLRDRNGRERILTELVGPIPQHGLVVVFRDVTLERALEEEARKARHMESLGILAGGIAHDFNNVLTSILGCVNLAQLSDLAPDVQEALGDAERGCLTARGLTKQLLTFAKGGSPVKSTQGIGELVRESVRLCLHGSPVTASVELDSDLDLVDMDPVQIAQVLNNLVLNAVQAMPEGGVVEIRGSNEHDGSGERVVALRVTDSGPGISESEAARIFDPYFTTKNEHSGLGLATSYWIIKRHGGSLRLVDTSPRGTTFELLLAASREPTIQPAPKRDDPRLGALRLLLMDDEDAVRDSIGKMLRYLGQDVVLTSKGEEAIEAFGRAREEGRPFDAVLLDLTVRGGMGGQRTLERLRELDPSVTAIVISGYSDSAVLANHERHGFVGRLEKPFRLTQLKSVLAGLQGAPAEKTRT